MCVMMATKIDLVAEIQSRFSNEEIELDNKLYQIERDENILLNRASEHSKEKGTSGRQFCASLEAAKKRNNDILKALEIAKARLRSRAAYSPTEAILEQATERYMEHPSLEPTLKRLYGPTFV